MSAPELKPCPFCGEAASVRDDTYHKTAVFITCGTLGCFGADQWDETQAEAIAAWNTRADLCDSTQDERVKRLVDALQAWDQYDKGSDDGPNAGVQMMLDYDRAMRLTRAALRDMEQDT